jgi:hypothetical protein
VDVHGWLSVAWSPNGKVLAITNDKAVELWSVL